MAAPCSMWNFPNQGLNLCPLQQKHRVLTTGPLEKFWKSCFWMSCFSVSCLPIYKMGRISTCCLTGFLWELNELLYITYVGQREVAFPKCYSFTYHRPKLLAVFSIMYLVFFFKLSHFLSQVYFKRKLHITMLNGKTESCAGGTSVKEPACQGRRSKRCRFDPWVGKIPWRRAWQPAPVFLPGESHGQRSRTGYSPQGHRVKHDWSRTWLKRLGKHAHCK